MAMDKIDFLTDFKLLSLLAIANMMPIVARHLFKERLSTPIDFNKKFIDEKPILGSHKTWRGLIASIIGTWIASFFIEIDQLLAIQIAFWSMIGDMTASFIKRRRGLESGAKFTGVDQAIESLLPLVILKRELEITWFDVALVTSLFMFFEIVLSPFFYKIGFRRNPY